MLPIEVRLNPVAIADVDSRLARHIANARVEGVDTPLVDLLEEHIKRGFVELNDIDPERAEIENLVVDDVGKGKREIATRTVVAIEERIHDRHWSRYCNLERTIGHAAGEANLAGVHAGGAANRRNDTWAIGFIAIAADSAPHLLGEIDAFDAGDESMDEVLPRLFAVGHDVDPGVLLFEERDSRRVAHRFGERVPALAPLRPKAFRLGEPRWLRQTAGDRRRKKHCLRRVLLRAVASSALAEEERFAHAKLNGTMPRRFLGLALLALSACRLDVTQTIDVTQQGREVITYRETFDDEAFSATTQLGGAAAFGFDAAKQDGWNVSGSSGPNEHTFLFERTFAGQDVEADLTQLAGDSAAATPGDAFFLGPTAFIGLPITASATNPEAVLIPALLRPSETVTKAGRDDPAFQLANARVNAAAVNTVVHVLIELHDATGIHRIEPGFAADTTFSPSSGATLQVGRPWKISSLLAFWRAVGPYGVFDYVHHAPPLCKADPEYRKAWMFGVRVYANGARMPEQLMTSAGTLAEDWLAKHPVKCP
jgi:hypothetical protein